MKAKILIMVAIAFMSGVFNLVAQEQDTITDARQLKAMNHIKVLIKNLGNKVLLPKAINRLIGQDSLENIYIVPQLDKAYFETEKEDIVTLIIPAKAYDEKNVIASELNVVYDNDFYHRVVYTDFLLETDTTTEYLSVCSNMFGDLVGLCVYDKDKILEDYVSISNDGVSARDVNKRRTKNKGFKLQRTMPSISDELRRLSWDSKYPGFYIKAPAKVHKRDK